VAAAAAAAAVLRSQPSLSTTCVKISKAFEFSFFPSLFTDYFTFVL
jgi:hypothetical protein